MLAVRFRQSVFLCLFLLNTLFLTACNDAQDSKAIYTVSSLSPGTEATRSVLPSLTATVIPLSPTTTLLPATTNPSTNGSYTQVSNSERFRQDWLHGIPCSAPCWEGITPDKTTAEQTLTILKSFPEVSKINFVEDSPLTAQVEWQWNLNNNKFLASILFRRSSTNNPYLVYAIYGFPDSVLAGSKPYSLGEVIENLGQPDYVAARIGNANFEPPVPIVPLYNLYIVYATKGFYISVFGKEKPKLDKDLATNNPIFFHPNELKVITPNKVTFVSWQGYKDFCFYYRTDGDSLCNA